MKGKMLLLSTMVLCFAVGTALAADVTLGTWKLNLDKSDFGIGLTAKVMKVEAVGDNIKITVDGKNDAGQITHSEFVGKYDGKEYPVTGDPSAGVRTYKKIDDYTFEMVGKNNGRVTATSKIVYSRDGKIRTVSETAGFGEGTTYTIVWDKQ